MLASLDLDQPSSPGSDVDYVPDVPEVPAASAVPESTPKRSRGRPKSTPRGGRGRGRGCGRGAPAQDDPVAPGLIGPVDSNQVPVGQGADAPAAATVDPAQDPVAPGPIEPVDLNQVPVGQRAGRLLQDLGAPPNPTHNWAVGY